MWRFLFAVNAIASSSAAPADTFGSWYFVADGNGTTPSTSAQDPAWLAGAGNFVSVAFIDPAAIDSVGDDALPTAFRDHVGALTGAKLTTMFAVGGMVFSQKWTFLASAARARAAAKVCAGWAKRYGVGIEIDYEGPDGGYGGWGVTWDGVSTLSPTFQNLAVFIEAFREEVPFGSGLLTLDVYASQGGGPCLGYFLNRYLPGMPASNPPWVKSGAAVGLKAPMIDHVNIMVATGDSADEAIGYLDGYVGPGAKVATQNNPVGISAPLPEGRATISLISGHHCAKLDSDMAKVIAHVKQVKAKGIMTWAIAPFGCEHNTDPLHISDWDCQYNASCPGLALAKARLLGQ
jgi:hypothetical protein